MSAIACRVEEGSYAGQALDYLNRMVTLFEQAKEHVIVFHSQVCFDYFVFQKLSLT